MTRALNAAAASYLLPCSSPAITSDIEVDEATVHHGHTRLVGDNFYAAGDDCITQSVLYKVHFLDVIQQENTGNLLPIRQWRRAGSRIAEGVGQSRSYGNWRRHCVCPIQVAHR
jgi:hypothetical protein